MLPDILAFEGLFDSKSDTLNPRWLLTALPPNALRSCEVCRRRHQLMCLIRVGNSRPRGTVPGSVDDVLPPLETIESYLVQHPRPVSPFVQPASTDAEGTQ